MSQSAYKYIVENLLIEEERFQAKSKKTGKVITYKSKEARDAAIKKGEAEKFDSEKPDADSEFGKDYVSKFQGTDEPSDEYERDFDDPPFGGDTGVDADFGMDDTRGNPDDAWDDEEGRAVPQGKKDADAWDDDEEARAAAFADMEDEFGDEDDWDDSDEYEESIKIINGKKYKAIKESTDISKVGELHERMKVNWDKK
tara:strand:+ start:3661 stop:4257 length:597 start_codon:yes stop_codon:yes gene_type:complete